MAFDEWQVLRALFLPVANAVAAVGQEIERVRLATSICMVYGRGMTPQQVVALYPNSMELRTAYHMIAAGNFDEIDYRLHEQHQRAAWDGTPYALSRALYRSKDLNAVTGASGGMCARHRRRFSEMDFDGWCYVFWDWLPSGQRGWIIEKPPYNIPVCQHLSEVKLYLLFEEMMCTDEGWEPWFVDYRPVVTYQLMDMSQRLSLLNMIPRLPSPNLLATNIGDGISTSPVGLQQPTSKRRSDTLT